MGVRLANKVALVTGGASGIGRATAVLFGQEGARVGIVDVEEIEGARVADMIVSAGSEAIFIRADVSVSEDAQAAVNAVVRKFGRLDILFNNAGISHVGVLHETLESDWERVIAVNLRGVFLMAKYSIPYMLDANGGTIINMSSSLALVGAPSRAVYSATKGGVLALTRAMAVDYADRHIRVNALCPGTVYTPFVERYLQASYPDPDVGLEQLKQRQLTGRLGRPEEIAAAALFLASDESDFMTGAPLIVDGGFTGGRRA